MADLVISFAVGIAASLVAAAIFVTFWPPSLDKPSLRIFEAAVYLLPPELRERYEEEWLAHLCEVVPTERLKVAISFILAAGRIRSELTLVRCASAVTKGATHWSTWSSSFTMGLRKFGEDFEQGLLTPIWRQFHLVINNSSTKLLIWLAVSLFLYIRFFYLGFEAAGWIYVSDGL